MRPATDHSPPTSPARRPAGGKVGRRTAWLAVASAALVLAWARPPAAPRLLAATLADTIPPADTTPIGARATPPADTVPPAARAAPPADTVPPAARAGSADTATVEGEVLREPGGRAGLGAGATGDSIELVDRVVAVAGDSAILLSELREELFRMRQQGLKLPTDPAGRDSLVKIALSNMVDRLLLVQQAEQSGVSVSNSQVNQVVQEQFARIRSNFQSDEAFRQAVEGSGQNMYQYRQMLTAQARQQLILNQFRQQLFSEGKLPPASVSDSAVRNYFDSNAGTAKHPATVSFERITVVPRPDSAAADSAYQVARKALSQIQAGTEFAVVARRYSDDPGTRSQGGDMGWIRRSDVVPGLADALWQAPPGRAVGPIETRFGFHIIKVENVRGGEREVRQILIRPHIDSAEVATARQRGSDVADSLQAGANAERLGREYGIPDQETRFEDVELSQVGQRFGAGYATALAHPKSGDVVGPFRVSGAFDLPEFVVLEVTDFKPAGPYRFGDVKDQIRERLVRQKQFEEYLAQLRRRMYVKILI